MTSIDHLDACFVDLPTMRPHKLAMHTPQWQTLVLLRLTCSNGSQGLSEATSIGGLAYAGESPETIKTNLETCLTPPGDRPGPQCPAAER